MYEEFVIVCYLAGGRRGDDPEGGDGLMADGGILGRLDQLSLWGNTFHDLVTPLDHIR